MVRTHKAHLHQGADSHGVLARFRPLRFFRRRTSTQVLLLLIHAALAFTIFSLFEGLTWNLEDHLGNKPNDATFRVKQGDFPVLNDSEPQRFQNLPIGELRPVNQFSSSSLLPVSQASPRHESIVLTIITVTRNPRHVFRDTAKFVQTQSLRPIRWLIVNDHSESVESYIMLREVVDKDGRFLLINNTNSPGFSSGRNCAIQHLLRHPTKYFAFLDDDDMFELTAYEKCAWMLESLKNASICGTYVVGFGARKYKWIQGLHNGARVVNKNPLTGSEIMRAEILSSTNCRFDESLKTGMEDWEFYLCVATNGRWGATIPELLFWYRQNPIEMRQKRWSSLFATEEETAEYIQKRYEGLDEGFPNVVIRPTSPYEKLNFTLPFRNALGLGRNVLMIIPWMAIGGGDAANLALVKELSRRGYRVTIVCTLLHMHSDSMESKPLFMQYTHDIFILPGMMRLADAPRFISYLIESRRAELLLLSNSQLGYGLLPWIRTKYAALRIVDYVHNEEPKWKSGGYAAYSTVHQASVDRTFTSSKTARQYMIDQGHNEFTVEVGYLGISLDNLPRVSLAQKLALRDSLNIPRNSTVVIFLGRMVPHKKPRVALEAFIKALSLIRKSEGGRLPDKDRYTLLMGGEGQMLPEIKRLSAPHGDMIRTLGRLGHSSALQYLAASDIFCLPSLSEGVSFALAEAMALGVTPLTSRLGGFPELLGENGEYGLMVNVTGDVGVDSNAFALPLKNLLLQQKRREEIGRKAVARVQSMFNAKKRIPDLVDRILETKRRQTYDASEESALSMIHYAYEALLRNMGVFSDYAGIRNSLEGKPRNEYGRRYRVVCGEYSEVVTRLIDMLEKPRPCEKGQRLDIKGLRINALEQCGRWCIMNLDDSRLQSGWHVRERCGGIDSFDDENHKCVTWFKALAEKT